MEISLYSVASILLFALESYHCYAHILVMCGIRTLPRKDLVRSRLYFLIDGLTVFSSSFLLTGRLRWLAAIQNVQHLYYWGTWNQSYLAKRIIDWSSLEWMAGSKKDPQLDSALGTFFDVFVHGCMAYVISEQMDMISIIISVLVLMAGMRAILYNPNLAWSGPNNMPAWIRKRLAKPEVD